jgi:glycosyltransferase involved in cell wall biosynthesis
MKKTAIISTILANYRYEIANLLSKQEEVEYTFFTSKNSHSGIKPVDSYKSKVDPKNGGIRWLFVKNIYLKAICVWQKGVFKVGFSQEYSTLILLGNMYCLSTWINALLGRLTGKHIIYWSHGLKGGDAGLKLLLRILFYKLSHDLFIYENRSKSLLLKEGFEPERVHVIYNSLAYSSHLKLRSGILSTELKKKKYSIFNNDYPTIVYSGRLIKAKRVDMIFSALALMDDYQINCLIIGDGDYENKLKKIVEKLDLKNVFFYGECYDETLLSKLIGMSDILVSPGNVGLAVVHAFSFGTPVISHDNLINQMPEVEIIELGVNGVLFKEGDIEDLKVKILNWIEKNKSNREFIREKCYEKVDKFYNPNFQVKVFNKIVKRGILKK